MHEVWRRGLLQGVRGGLQEMPRGLQGDAAVTIGGGQRVWVWSGMSGSAI